MVDLLHAGVAKLGAHESAMARRLMDALRGQVLIVGCSHRHSVTHRIAGSNMDPDHIREAIIIGAIVACLVSATLARRMKRGNTQARWILSQAAQLVAREFLRPA